MISSIKGQRSNGFSLIETMIAVAIAGILTTTSLPVYTEYVHDSRRSDAKSELQKVALAQERWRATHASYTTTLSDLGVSATSSQGYYSIAVTAADAVGFKAVATPAGVQAGDSCGKFATNVHGRLTTSGYASEDCWR